VKIDQLAGKMRRGTQKERDTDSMVMSQTCFLSSRKENRLKTHIQELICTPPNIIRRAKSRGMRWLGRVARTREMRCAHKTLVGKSEGGGHLGDFGIGMIILKLIL
jgi:hypothetical protein